MFIDEKSLKKGGCLNRVFIVFRCLNRLFYPKLKIKQLFKLKKLLKFIKNFEIKKKKFFIDLATKNRKVFKLENIENNMFGLFKRKKEIEEIKEETKKGFDSVKKDIVSVSGWIKHLDSEKNTQKSNINELKEELSSIRDEIEGIKNAFEIMNQSSLNRLSKNSKQAVQKQTAVQGVQTGVQTGVETPNLDKFSITERAILWVLLNSDMKLSYEDIGAMLGKEKSTIRGQINRIKQKSESLIEELYETNGKKRVYIPEKTKEKLLKKAKVRVKGEKKDKKKKKVSDY